MNTSSRTELKFSAQSCNRTQEQTCHCHHFNSSIPLHNHRSLRLLSPTSASLRYCILSGKNETMSNHKEATPIPIPRQRFVPAAYLEGAVPIVVPKNPSTPVSKTRPAPFVKLYTGPPVDSTSEEEEDTKSPRSGKWDSRLSLLQEEGVDAHIYLLPFLLASHFMSERATHCVNPPGYGER